MSEALLLCWTLLATSTADTSLIGGVRATGSGPNRQVVLTADNKDTYLLGNLVVELGHLSGSKVEVLGRREGAANLRVEAYRILDVGGGARPLVGTLVGVTGGGMALADGEGDPLPLSLNATSQAQLQTMLGAKIWVFGKKLLSGELRVARCGILRGPVGMKVVPQTDGEKP